MTSIRKSAVIAFEDASGFGKGLPLNEGSATTYKKWHKVPPGFFLSHQHTRSTNRIDATGNKKWDYVAYGAYSGQWDLSFNLDYRYMDLLCAVFEDYSSNLITSGDKGTSYVVNSKDSSYFTACEEVADLDTLKKISTPSSTILYLLKDTNLAYLYTPSEKWKGFSYAGTSEYLKETYTYTYDTGETEEYVISPEVRDDEGNVTTEAVKGTRPITATATAYRYLAYLYPRFTHGDIESDTEIKTADGDYLSDQAVELTFKLGYTENSTQKYLYMSVLDGYLTWDTANTKMKAYDSSGIEMTYGVTGPKYLHTFKKCNTKKIPSFTIRQKTLNVIAGGTHGDEILELRGCVLKSIRFSITAGASQISVSASGFCTREYTWIDELESTDYYPTEGTLAEFACLFKGEVDSSNYISLVESAQISIANNAERLDSTCTPFAPSYYEGKTENAVNITVYSNDPTLFKQRLYAGGAEPNSTMDTWTTTETTSGNPTHSTYSYLNSPMCKNLHPMPLLSLISYDVCKKEDETWQALKTRANHYLEFSIVDCVVKSMSWQRGDGQKITDQLSSAECYDIYLTVISDVPNYKDNEKTAISVQTALPLRTCE